jgi:hypothetical protein
MDADQTPIIGHPATISPSDSGVPTILLPSRMVDNRLQPPVDPATHSRHAQPPLEPPNTPSEVDQDDASSPIEQDDELPPVEQDDAQSPVVQFSHDVWQEESPGLLASHSRQCGDAVTMSYQALHLNQQLQKKISCEVLVFEQTVFSTIY